MARMSDIRKKAQTQEATSTAAGSSAARTQSTAASEAPTKDAEVAVATANAADAVVVGTEPDPPPTRQWVLFQCAGVQYALDSAGIALIEMLGEITRVPNTADAVAGVFNLRGDIIPVIDLRARLGYPAADYGLAARIIIAQHARRRIGIIVDSAREVLRISDAEIHMPPQFMHQAQERFVQGIVVRDERTILLLDLGSVLQLDTSVEAAIIHHHAIAEQH